MVNDNTDVLLPLATLRKLYMQKEIINSIGK